MTYLNAEINITDDVKLLRQKPPKVLSPFAHKQLCLGDEAHASLTAPMVTFVAGVIALPTAAFVLWRKGTLSKYKNRLKLASLVLPGSAGWFVWHVRQAKQADTAAQKDLKRRFDLYKLELAPSEFGPIKERLKAVLLSHPGVRRQSRLSSNWASWLNNLFPVSP